MYIINSFGLDGGFVAACFKEEVAWVSRLTSAIAVFVELSQKSFH